MSKLADLIRRAAKSEPTSIGFGAGARKPAPTMLLIACIGERWSKGAADAQAADALLLTGRPREQDLSEAGAAAGERPCGGIASEADADALSRLRSAGLDFAVVSTQASASALLEEDLGLVLHLRDDLPDVQLRALENRPLDALYLEQDAQHPLTIRRQLDLQRISGLARKPLLVPVRPNAEQHDLLSLRESGATLLALDLSERGAPEALPRLRAVIDALPPRRKPRAEEREVSLLGSARAASDDDDEDDD